MKFWGFLSCIVLFWIQPHHKMLRIFPRKTIIDCLIRFNIRLKKIFRHIINISNACRDGNSGIGLAIHSINQCNNLGRGNFLLTEICQNKSVIIKNKSFTLKHFFGEFCRGCLDESFLKALISEGVFSRILLCSHRWKQQHRRNGYFLAGHLKGTAEKVCQEKKCFSLLIHDIYE